MLTSVGGMEHVMREAISTHWEVDDCRVLLGLLLRVLGEALDMHDQVLGQPSELVPALIAVHHLLRRVPIEL